MKIITIPSAKSEIRRLQHFIDVVELYEANNLERWIIKEYAYTGSIREVVLRSRYLDLKVEGEELTTEFVAKIIASNPKDELHRIIRANYRIRTKRHKKNS